jgi:hypothetical protein
VRASFTNMPAAPIPLPMHILVHRRVPFLRLSSARPVTTCRTPAVGFCHEYIEKIKSLRTHSFPEDAK